MAGIPPAARAISLGVEDAAERPIAERIALNARDAGLAVSVVARAAGADARLVEVRIDSSDPAAALAGMAVSLVSLHHNSIILLKNIDSGR